jgi:pimeloyl-ACP methyl ester carboxylesterase
VKAYVPVSGKGPFPAVLFSHGLGGSRESYAYLGKHWASHGFVSVHVQHAGTDKRIFSSRLDAAVAMRDAVRNRENLAHRPLDVRFALDRILEGGGDPDSRWAGLVDRDRLGIAGHSMGAATALACAGRLFGEGESDGQDLSDRRFRACLAMSPSSGGPESSRAAYRGFFVPSMHMTGTHDDSPIGGTKREHRRVPFDSIPAGVRFLLMFKGLDHMAFSDLRLPADKEWKNMPRLPRRIIGRFFYGAPNREGKHDPFFHAMIRMAGTAFWDAFLRMRQETRAWMLDGGFTRDLWPDVTCEIFSERGMHPCRSIHS